MAAQEGVRHEALDSRVYAYAALRALVAMGLAVEAEDDRPAAQDVPLGGPRPTLPRVNRSRWMVER